MIEKMLKMLLRSWNAMMMRRKKWDGACVRKAGP